MQARAECPAGTILGSVSHGVASFKGIPYTGEPPTGENRWMPPVPFKADSRTIDASEFSPAPPQLSDGRFPTDENCLRLNIWASAGCRSEDRPVVLWIHGGSFTSGSTSHPLYSGAGFVAESPDVVFVSAGYRLGALGFLDVSEIPGGEGLEDTANLGIMDLGMALRWVHENIGAFGGDSGNITVMGQSAGAACATLLASSEMYSRMMRRVIAESGSPSFTCSEDYSRTIGEQVARSLGCETLDDLRAISAEKLGNLSRDLSMKVWPSRSGKTVPKDPYEELGKRRIDVLSGSNLKEMDAFASYIGKGMLSEVANRALPKGSAGFDDIGRLMELADGILFSGPAELLALRASRSGGRGYRYLWTAPTGHPGYGAHHGAEVPAILRSGQQGSCKASLDAHRMWASFARDGVPSEDWPTCEADDRAFLVIEESGPRVSREPLPDAAQRLEGTYLL